MSRIESTLVPDEKILFQTRKHLIIFVPSVIMLLLSFWLAWFMTRTVVLAHLAWVPPIIGLVYFSISYIVYLTSRFVVTNKRVIMREGFFNRHANELRLGTISQVNIDQGIFGQIFGYGDVSLNAFGAFDVFFYISRPYAFQQAVTEQMDKVVR